MGHTLSVYDIESKYWNTREIINQTVDAVIITASSVNHWPITEYCLDLDIPVYCEKPLLLKEEQLHELKIREQKKILMVGHQLLFVPEVVMLKSRVNFMSSIRSGSIPRTEGALFSLMVHDIAVAHYVTGKPQFECIWAEGNRHELKVTLRNELVIVDLYAKSISDVRLRHTTMIDNETFQPVHLSPDNWKRPDLLEKALTAFTAYVQRGHDIGVNGTTDAINVMETVFKIQSKLNEKTLVDGYKK